MSISPPDDDQTREVARAALEARAGPNAMTSFVEACVETAAGSAVALERRSRHRPPARKLLRVLKDKRNILVTTHEHPDPDALASSMAMCELLSARLPGAKVNLSIKGQVGGGLNSAFAQESGLEPLPWDDTKLGEFDAIVLLDVQPTYKYSPLPAGVTPTAVIDHHRSRGRKTKCPFSDVRPEVGASSSIVFSYFMETETEISPDLAASLIFGIETDLAGLAGQPGELDNMALSSLTLIADTRKLYRMRYVDLPQSYYLAYANGLSNAMYYDNVMTSFLDAVDSPEKPAVIADFLLRFDQVQTVLVTAVHRNALLISLRSSNGKVSAAELVRRLVRHIGEGGGHKSKAGGLVPLENGSPSEIERIRATLRRRFLRALNISASRGQRLVPQRANPVPAKWSALSRPN